MGLYLACPCGRAIPVPDGHVGPTVPCPDCGRTVPLDGAPPPPRRQRPPIRIQVGDLGCLAALAAVIAISIAVPGVGRALGAGALACCVAPALGFSLVGWLVLRRWRAQLEAAQREGAAPPPPGGRLP